MYGAVAELPRTHDYRNMHAGRDMPVTMRSEGVIRIMAHFLLPKFRSCPGA